VQRTDRNNNPIAAAVPAGAKNAYTKALDAAGVPWTYGDGFPGDPSIVTIKILGDPVEGARAILAGSHALQDWYVNHTGAAVMAKYGVANNADFATLDRATQDAIIAGIYQHEGGSGQLVANRTPAPVSDPAFPSDLSEPPILDVSPSLPGSSDLDSLQAALGVPYQEEPGGGEPSSEAGITNSLTDGTSGTTIAVAGLIALGLGLYFALK
jgi:hypothetical protein